MQIFAMQRATGDGVGMGLERRRTAMDCITNTHDTSARMNTPRKRRLSDTVHLLYDDVDSRLAQTSIRNNLFKNLISSPLHRHQIMFLPEKVRASQTKSAHPCFEEATLTSQNISLKSVLFKLVGKVIQTQLTSIPFKLQSPRTPCCVMLKDASKIPDPPQFQRV